MNNTDYHVTKIMPTEKMKAIINVEGVCPVCKSRKTYYQRTFRCNEQIWQNKYFCRDCSSEWVGNTYRDNFERITSEEERRMSIQPNPVLQGLAYLFAM